MRQKTDRHQDAAERTIKDIRRQTRKRYSSEEKIRIVLAGLRGEDSIAELCRQEGIAQGMYYSWSKEFLEAGKKRLAGDTAKAFWHEVWEYLMYMQVKDADTPIVITDDPKAELSWERKK